MIFFLKEKSHEHSAHIHFKLAFPRAETCPFYQGQENGSGVQSSKLLSVVSASIYQLHVALRVKKKLLKTLTEVSD